MAAARTRRRVTGPRYREQAREAKLTHHLHQTVSHHERNQRLFVGVTLGALLGMGASMSRALGALGGDLVYVFGAVAIAALLLAAVHGTKARSMRRKL